MFYVLSKPTGAGDEPLAVSTHRSEIVYEQLSTDGVSFVREVGFDEFVETMLYLGYDTELELMNFGKKVKNGEADYSERNGMVEKTQIDKEISFRGYYVDPDGQETYRSFDTEEQAYNYSIEPRYRVVRDLQGGDFGMMRYYTIEEWREQAIEWLNSDGASKETLELWLDMPANEVIQSVEEWWQLEILECRKISQNNVKNLQN